MNVSFNGQRLNHPSGWNSANKQLGVPEVSRPSAYRSLETIDESSERQATASVIRSVKSLLSSGSLDSAKNLVSSLSASPVKESLYCILVGPDSTRKDREDNDSRITAATRVWGQYAGRIQFDDSFDEMPDDFMRHFEP